MKKYLIISLKLAISAGILWYIFTKVPFNSIVESLSTANPFFILLAYLVFPVAVFTAALQIHILTRSQGMSLNVRQIFSINYVTYFYNLFLPGYLAGGAIRWYKFSQHEGKRVEAFSAIIATRYLDFVVVTAVGIFFWCADPIARTHHSLGLTLGGLLFFLCLGMYIFMNKRVLAFFSSVVERVHFIPALLRRVLLKIAQSFDSFHALQPHQKTLLILLLTAKYLLGILSTYLMACSLSLPLSMINLGWIQTFMYVLMMLPISFQGLGVREGGMIALVNMYGIAQVNAVSLSFLMFSMCVIAGFIGAIIEAYTFLFGRKKKDETLHTTMQ
ncbi:lysylphosphatidylglycerol synthase transmembrane domain-containing protein [Candidatus Omnitrophota bacterium]